MEMYIWLAIAAFTIWIYEQARRSLERRATNRERRLRAALEALSSAAAALDEVIAPAATPSPELESRLRERLLRCHGMQGFASDVDGQLALYLHGEDADRLPLLHAALHRELDRTRHELALLLEHEERPSWGSGFLRLLKPALIPALLAAASAAGWQFAQEPEFGGSQTLPLLRLTSWLLAALLAARLLEPGYRAERPIMRRVLPLLAAAPALLNPALGLEAAPWLLAAQLILAAAGFAALRPAASKRRERPYAGHSPQLSPASAQPADANTQVSAHSSETQDLQAAPSTPRSSRTADSLASHPEAKTALSPR
ncbi:hypothetical protein [Saccharibacillus sp. JS10]|uniref:hypothetical protein n=1 Tax=Saccharibacillus sp. JS10 TaxID=2950552 RepID=UPI00210DB826|nr:hypothetical protein [Saccharibacillus sp. JS10]MCQ4087406.1 hypothetical protein [Saccharibacillus sp. JS10]